jgi:hypothetical protein
VGVVATCTSTGAELVRTCGHGGAGGLGEDVEGTDDAEKFLGEGEGGRGLGLGCGRSSGIGILLRCTVRLDGGVYAFGGSSSLIRCSPMEGLLSSITYWCSSSDNFPELTSAEIIRGVRREVGTDEIRVGWTYQLTTFVSQALHVLDYLQDLWYVGWRGGANGDEQHRVVLSRVQC